MNTITVGQMQQLTRRLDNIMGAVSSGEIKRKRLDQLQADVRERFDIGKDIIAYQFWAALIEHWAEVS